MYKKKEKQPVNKMQQRNNKKHKWYLRKLHKIINFPYKSVLEAYVKWLLTEGRSEKLSDY